MRRPAGESCLRVISGQAGGLRLQSVPGRSTRPTADRVKEAMFSIIGPYFSGERVLDLFAGTGALGIEALSRGAGRAVFVDRDPRCAAVIRRNLEHTGLSGRAEVIRGDVRRAVEILSRREETFELIFLDPPYDRTDCDELLADLSARGLVSPGAVAVVEHRAGADYEDRFAGYTLRRRAVYGDTALSIYDHGGLTE